MASWSRRAERPGRTTSSEAGRAVPAARGWCCSRGGVDTGCGPARRRPGPFYCPADRKVYLDLGFFRELRGRFGAPGDFAQAYVIAHEFGHHVQNLLGIMQPGRARRSARTRASANELSVRLELQADCLAGVWAHSAYERSLLEEGDLEEGLDAAAAVGDDRIQAADDRAGSTRRRFTHGTSEQRASWFKRGFEGGDATRLRHVLGRHLNVSVKLARSAIAASTR